MRIAALVWIAALPSLALAEDRIAEALEDAARVASVMVDGDLCQRIVTPKAWEAMFQKNPKDQWLYSDNYDVDDRAFNAVKKTLARISRLISFPADANLWLPAPGHPDKIHITIRSSHELSQFWPWGALYQNIPAPMKTVLETGRRITVTEKAGWVSVLTPVRNSLGEVVGLVEIAGQRFPDAHANVK